MWNIDFCRLNEVDQLKEFIDKKWSKNHILTRCDDLLFFQHLTDDKINFLIAKDDEGNIGGILGFILNKKYDSQIKFLDIWGAIWKVDETNPNTNGLGYLLYKYLIKTLNPDLYGALGVSQIAMNFYKILNYKVGIMNHYYLLNDSTKSFNIAKVGINSDYKSFKDINNYTLRVVEDISCVELKHQYKPQKTIKYLINRYKKHPVYNYIFMGIYRENVIVSIFVCRKIDINNSGCFRIVDIYGNIDNIDGSIFSQLQDFLKNEKAEYIDCINFGIDDSIFNKIGFEKLDHEGKTIIPNYFEPFEQRNIQLEFAYKSNYENVVIFKGDSDQDRPNDIEISYDEKY